MSIGKRIQKLRKDNKLTQVQFSKVIGISQGRLSEIEKDKNKPSVDTLESIKQNFNISLDWLIIGNYPISDNSDLLVSDSTVKYGEPDQEQFTNDEINIISLYRKLSVKEKNKIEGILEMKALESDSDKGKSSTSQTGGTGGANVKKHA
jgi:transcriptional regulator with XRE-family HTH domain